MDLPAWRAAFPPSALSESPSESPPAPRPDNGPQSPLFLPGLLTHLVKIAPGSRNSRPPSPGGRTAGGTVAVGGAAGLGKWVRGSGLCGLWRSLESRGSGPGQLSPAEELGGSRGGAESAWLGSEGGGSGPPTPRRGERPALAAGSQLGLVSTLAPFAVPWTLALSDALARFPAGAPRRLHRVTAALGPRPVPRAPWRPSLSSLATATDTSDLPAPENTGNGQLTSPREPLSGCLIFVSTTLLTSRVKGCISGEHPLPPDFEN